MILSNRKRFVFFAFNKTGSSSIERALGAYQSRIATRWLRVKYSHRGHPAIFKHASPLHVRPLLGERKWADYFKFCFVRNPFDRLVSLYFYHRQRIPTTHPLASQLTFDDWLLGGGAGSALRLMTDFVTDESGNLILDFIGRYENLASDFRTVCGQLGIKAELPYDNSTRRDHYSNYYSDRTRNEVERLFAEDLERFDYTFESQ